MRGIGNRLLLALLLTTATGCKLLDTTDDENTVGRGSAAFDPYDINSGAVKLGLSLFNGCAVLANGQRVGPNSATPASYPVACADPKSTDPSNPPPPSPFDPPLVPMQLLADTDYFLNQLSITETVTNTAGVTDDAVTASRWIRTQSSFKELSWDGLGLQTEEFKYGAFEAGWYRETLFGGAPWMRSSDDSFKVEVLGPAGQELTTVTYSRKEFLGESSTAGHNRVSWRVGPILPPEFPSDQRNQPLPAIPGGPPSGPPTSRTMVRLDLTGSANPFKSMRVSDYTGEAVIRVTWSLMPNTPWHFPVTFINPQTEVPPTCFDNAGGPVRCTVGLQVQAKLTRPANELGYYAPGELFEATFDLRDGSGNRLHRPGFLPSYSQVQNGTANGLLYFYQGHWSTLEERDVSSSFQVVGPLDALQVVDPRAGPEFFTIGDHFFSLAPDLAGEPFPGFKGLFELEWPAKTRVQIPPQSKPGTYALIVRASRHFYGERLSRTETFYFQVGQPEATAFPGKVGNCQICHLGVLSMDNLRHGQSVDEVETCKACHSGVDDFPGRINRIVHQVHMQSTKYNRSKSDCSVCHLTTESTLRPSVDTCTSCHVSAHAGEYFQTQFRLAGTPNRFSNCAQACHGEAAPGGHTGVAR